MAIPLFGKAPARISASQERLAFTRKVISAAKSSNFSAKELSRLEKLLDKMNKRDLVLLYGALSTMRIANLPPGSLRAIKSILSAAYRNILLGIRPFDNKAISELTNELEKNLSKKIASRLTKELLEGDQTLITGLLNYLSRV